MASSGNFSTWNPLRYSSTSGITYSDGNCKVETTTGYPTCMNNFAPQTGKWYIEFYNHENNGYNVLGIVQQSSITKYGNWLPDEVYQKQYLFYSHNGNKARRNADGSGTSSSYGSSWGSGNQIIGCALDLDNGKVWWSLNGTFQASGDPAAGSNSAFDDLDTTDGFFMAYSDYNGGADGIMGINCGQDSTFGGAITAGGNADANGFGDFKYAPPSGFLALCSANLPTSDDIDPAQTDDDYPSKQFGSVLYTGNGSSNAITGLGFQPDLVWGKCRSHAQAGILIDSSRGQGLLFSSETSAEQTSNGPFMTSYDSDGFTLASSGSNPNDSGRTYVAWCWRANGGTTATNNDGNTTTTIQANSDAGFSIVTWSGTGTNSRTLGTGLSKQAEFVIVKNRADTCSWIVYHHQANGGAQPNDYGVVLLNSHVAYSEGSGALTYWDISEWSNSVFSVGGDNCVNGSSDNMLAYCWHSVEGYSKFGSYVGNGNADGPFVYTGFRPRMIYLKSVSGGAEWTVFDTARETYNQMEDILQWDITNAETQLANDKIDFLSNGFKLRGAGGGRTNQSGHTYIYGAWGDVPFKYNNTF